MAPGDTWILSRAYDNPASDTLVSGLDIRRDPSVRPEEIRARMASPGPSCRTASDRGAITEGGEEDATFYKPPARDPGGGKLASLAHRLDRLDG